MAPAERPQQAGKVVEAAGGCLCLMVVAGIARLVGAEVAALSTLT